jgi:hypothetical protein
MISSLKGIAVSVIDLAKRDVESKENEETNAQKSSRNAIVSSRMAVSHSVALGELEKSSGRSHSNDRRDQCSAESSVNLLSSSQIASGSASMHSQIIKDAPNLGTAPTILNGIMCKTAKLLEDFKSKEKQWSAERTGLLSKMAAMQERISYLESKT